MPLFNPPPTSGAGSGTVTSVGLTTPGLLDTVSGSPVTGAGTLALALKVQAANRVLAGPTTGADAVPTVRALVAGDVPAVNPSALTGSGTVPLAALSGLTTSQLDAAAGIGSGQIASVAAGTLTGSHTLPDGVLSTNVPLLGAANAFSVAPLKVTAATPATANYGSLSVGDGPWDGTTSGFFAGTSSGACIATNPASGFGGRLLDLQVAGVSKFRVDSGGSVVSLGGFSTNLTTQSSSYSAGSTDTFIVVNASSIIVTLQSSAGRTGRMVIVKNNNQTTTTVKTQSNQTIDGTNYTSSGYALNTAYGMLRLVSDGSNWYSW